MIPNVLHLFWGRSRPLSWLRCVTVKSFASLNPDWRVIVWTSTSFLTPVKPAWMTREHEAAQGWSGPDWFEGLAEAGPNVEVREADLSGFPALDDVHRSDLFRWRILHRSGGWWSDFDIVFFKPMDKLLPLIDLKADALLCRGEIEELKKWQAIGFLAGAPGSLLYGDMEAMGLKLAEAPDLAYQDLGELLLKRWVKPGETDLLPGCKIGYIPQAAVYPFHNVSGQMKALWRRHDLNIRPYTVGLHWFGGQKKSAEEEARLQGPGDFRDRGAIKWACGEIGIVHAGRMKEEVAVGPGGGLKSSSKYSFILPYINRLSQFRNTLVSFQHWYEKRNDWEIVLIEDIKCSPKDRERLAEIVAAWRKKGFRIKHLKQIGSMDQFNPSALFNAGAKEAEGKYLIISSPEVFHRADILAGLDTEFDDDDPDIYVICGCQDRGGCTTQSIERITELGGRRTKWFQHSVFRPANYHFCSALSRKNWERIGGFDETYCSGYCFDDDDFRERVRAANLQFVQRDDLLTFHQQHPAGLKPADWKEQWEKNRALYEWKWGPYIHLEAPAIIK